MSDWLSRKFDDRIAWMVEQARRWRPAPKRVRPFATIARDYGCEGFAVAEELTRRLNAAGDVDPPWAAYDRELVERVGSELSVSERIIKAMTTEHRTALEEFLRSMVLKIPSRQKIFWRVARVIRALAWHGHAVIVGRGGAFLCRDMPGGLHIRLVAPRAWRLLRLSSSPGGKGVTAETLQIRDRERQSFYRLQLGVDEPAGHHFDLVINNSAFPAPQAADLIIRALRSRGLFGA